MFRMNLKARTLLFVPMLLLGILWASQVYGTEEYAEQTGQTCGVCHFSESGGGALTPTGEAFDKDPASWKPPVEKRSKTPLSLRLVHLLILYTHILFGIVWIGTILYVHLVLKPKYALGGLPRSELKLAWLSMPIILVSGILLTIYKFKHTPGLFQTAFGSLLMAKIGIFIIMLCSATFVTLFVGPRLRKISEGHTAEKLIEKTEFTPAELHEFDGVDGRKTLVSIYDEIWDVSSSSMWKDGFHAGRHKAGQDLTEYIKQAPHGLEILSGFKKVGQLSPPDPGTPLIVRIFTVNAYLNLIACFLIILILAMWRW